MRTLDESFGQVLRTTRHAGGVSLARLARLTTFSESHLRNVENGHRAATRELAEACDKALDARGILVDFCLADQNGDDGRRFMMDPPLLVRGQLTGDLLILRRSMAESDSKAMRLATPRLMMLYGMTTANLGNSSDASRWYRAARLATEQVDDRELRLWVRGREAFRRGYEGASPDEVLALATGVDDVEAKLACRSPRAWDRLEP